MQKVRRQLIFLIKKKREDQEGVCFVFVHLLVLATASCTEGESNVVKFFLI